MGRWRADHRRRLGAPGPPGGDGPAPPGRYPAVPGMPGRPPPRCAVDRPLRPRPAVVGPEEHRRLHRRMPPTDRPDRGPPGRARRLPRGLQRPIRRDGSLGPRPARPRWGCHARRGLFGPGRRGRSGRDRTGGAHGADLIIPPDRTEVATAEDLPRSPETGPGAFLSLDTRSAEEVAGEMIPGAIHLDWRHDLDPDDRSRDPAIPRARYWEAGLPNDFAGTIAPYCDSGLRAAVGQHLRGAPGARISPGRQRRPVLGGMGRRPDLAVARLDGR